MRGAENLVWAPNKGHGNLDEMRIMIGELRTAESRNDVLNTLEFFGREAQRR